MQLELTCYACIETRDGLNGHNYDINLVLLRISSLIGGCRVKFLISFILIAETILFIIIFLCIKMG